MKIRVKKLALLISLLLTFSGRCRSCRSFLLSISSGTMDGQSNLHSDVVLVPTPVQFDKQREKQCEGVSPFREPCLCPVLARGMICFL